ncbi:MAG: aspartate/glutamate racemase family protein [Phycisphaerales bacterium]
MPKHIGIAAVSPEGSALCYREIFRTASRLVGDSGHPRVTLHNEPFEQYLEAALKSDWHTVGALLRRSAEVLAAAGAEFCITPDNLMQNAVHLAEHGSKIPWLSMTDVVAEAVAKDGRKAVGLIATRLVTLGSTYQTHLGIRGCQLFVPDEPDIASIDSIIFRELVHGVVRAESRERLRAVLLNLGQRGCEGVVLGYTEAGLLLTEEAAPLPLYDSNALLAQAAVRMSLGV